jgi:hypothetical protein
VGFGFMPKKAKAAISVEYIGLFTAVSRLRKIFKVFYRYLLFCCGNPKVNIFLFRTKNKN